MPQDGSLSGPETAPSALGGDLWWFVRQVGRKTRQAQAEEPTVAVIGAGAARSNPEARPSRSLWGAGGGRPDLSNGLAVADGNWMPSSFGDRRCDVGVKVGSARVLPVSPGAHGQRKHATTARAWLGPDLSAMQRP